MELIKDLHSSCEADFYRPLLATSSAKKSGKELPPYIPKWDCLPLHKLCRLAGLYYETHCFEEAALLAAWLLQLEPFPSLWCEESEFNEKNILHCFSKLREIPPKNLSNPSIDNFFLIKAPQLQAALTLDGKNTSLGAIRAGGVEIRAFGPQKDSSHFGIHGKGMDGWTRTAAYPEIWLEMKHKIEKDQLRLDFRFIGIKPETPLSLALYIRASTCRIDNEELEPKSLRRLQKETKKVEFANQFFIESELPQKVEVIPLAGEGCFWNCDFLLTYPISSFVPQISLSIS